MSRVLQDNSIKNYKNNIIFSIDFIYVGDIIIYINQTEVCVNGKVFGCFKSKADGNDW